MEARQCETACSEPIVILSDVHLRHRAHWRQDALRLRPLWQGARTVLFNGDTMTGNLACRPTRCRRIADYLRALCRGDGAEAIFLAGNSDCLISPVRHVRLLGRVLVTHGDVFFPQVSLWRLDRQAARDVRRQALNALPPERRETLEAQLWAAQAVTDSLHGPEDRSRSLPRCLWRRTGKYLRPAQWFRVVIGEQSGPTSGG